MDELLKELEELKASNRELIERCRLQGWQITEIKKLYEEMRLEVDILKEGGDI